MPERSGRRGRRDESPIRATAGHLEELWKRRISVLASNLAAGETEHEQIASLARHISADYHGRFLIELLQNASDQAEQGSRDDSKIVIVRAKNLVSISNQGAPFTADGINSITALGLSSKDPEFALGNKGVGFKAVFEVTSAPEVYSADDIDRPFDTGTCWFRLDERPWADRAFMARLSKIGEALLRENEPLRLQLAAHASAASPLARLMDGVTKSAPFRFPVPLARTALDGRIRSLSLPPVALSAETLIVLPLRDGAKTAQIVDKALDDLIQDGPHTLMFLPNVARIELFDATRKLTHRVSRGARQNPMPLARGSVAFDLPIETRTATGRQVLAREGIWRVVQRKVGGDPDRPQERQAIRDAVVASLPGLNWGNVESAQVSVSMPITPSDPATPFEIEADGRFCIGLPTLQSTGTPIWVDGRFHGNIARTKIDTALAYNELLFDEALLLCAELLDDLRTSPDKHRNRLVAVAVARTDNAEGVTGDDCLLAEAFENEDGLAHDNIVLSFDGSAYLTGAQLAVPAPADEDAFRFIRVAVEDLERFGVVLPDEELLGHARHLLARLPGSSVADGLEPSTYLERGDDGTSLLERTTAFHREAGPTFWEPFISWAAKRWSAQALDEQRFLPVAAGGLERPADKVFLRPATRTKLPDAADPDEPPAQQGESSETSDDDVVLADEIQHIPDEVARTLRFLDEQAIPSRVAGSITLTEVARLLAPDRDRSGLVRRPRIGDVLSDAVAPALQAATSKPGNESLAARLLVLALRWLGKMSSDARASFRTANLRVPVLGNDGSIAWCPPPEARFAQSWIPGIRGELLGRLTDAGVGRTLVPWDTFSKLAGVSDDQLPQWRQDFDYLGVWTGPRLIVVRRGLANRAPFKAEHGGRLGLTWAPCPIESAAAFWDKYVSSFRGYEVNVQSNQRYDFEEVTWLEGLERDGLAPLIMEMVLRSPSRYRDRAWTHLWRQEGRINSTSVRSLWADALKRRDWPVIPTELHGAARPSLAFQLEPEQRRADRFKFLPVVPSELNATDILKAVGVTTVGDAPPRRLFSALHRLASMLPLPADREQSATALAQDLFDRLQEACVGNAAIDLKPLVKAPVPLSRARSLVAVDVSTAPVVYVADDPARLRLFARSQPSNIPLSSDQRNDALVQALRSALGDDRVLYTSEAPVESGFAPTEPDEPPLIPSIAEAFPSRPLELDLALLVAYLGKERWGPNDDRFRDAWSRLLHARVRRGRFADWFEHRSMVEFAADGTPRLLISHELGPADLLESAHAVIGGTHRDVFASYVRALTEGTGAAVDHFFVERDVGATERDEIVAIVGSAGNSWLAPLRPIAFALWRDLNPTTAFSEFTDLWRATLSGDTTPEGLIGDAPSIEMLREATQESAEDHVAALLLARGISGPALRRAFDELGEAWRFSSCDRIFARLRVEICAALRAAAARSAKPDPQAVEAVVERFMAWQPPADLSLEPPSRARIVGIALAALKHVLAPEVPRSSGKTILGRLSGVDPSQLEPIRDSGLSNREVEEFFRSQAAREADAQELRDDILHVAAAIAARLSEQLDPSALRADPRISQRCEGALASRFVLLASFKEVLEVASPLTTAKLAGARAFHEPRTRQQLWDALQADLGPIAPPAPTPPPTVTVVNVALPKDELENELMKGAAGAIGKAIIGSCAAQLDFGLLRSRNHDPPPPARSPRPTDRRRTRGRNHQDALAQQRLVGALGEAFIFEQFKLTLPGFDHTNWVSENRAVYGLANGSDSFGADFEYLDSQGILTGRSDAPHCFIEVKSSTDDAHGPFFMTLSEWERAKECSRSSGGSVYLVVRVAFADTRPQVVDILIDPVALQNSGQIRLSGTEFCVSVGARL